jgi:hypothetical protein
MNDLLADVPVFIVIVHFVALVGLVIHVGVIHLQRFVVIRRSRNPPSAFWFRLLQVLLSLTK